MHLDEFIKEQQIKLESFKKYWMENHKKDPESFPLEIPEGNCGLWYEMFENFEDMNEDDTWEQL